VSGLLKTAPRLPKGHALVTLGEITESRIARTVPSQDFLYLDIGSVDRETKQFNAPETLTPDKAPSRARQFVQAGDVLVSLTRPNLNAVAQVQTSELQPIASTGFHVLRAQLVCGHYLFYLVQSDKFITQMSNQVEGALYPAIRPKHIESFEFALPPRAEQTRIVAKLDELLADLDAGVAELKAAQKKLAQYRQSLLKAAVSGELTAAWREKNPPKETGQQLLQRIVRERRSRWETAQLAKFKAQGKVPPKGWKEKYVEPVQPDVSELPQSPDGWTHPRVDLVGSVQLGRQRSPDKLTGVGSARYIRAANITERGIDFDDVLEMDFKDSERETFALGAGDVLLTEASGSPEHVGRPAIWPGAEGIYCFQNTVLRFRSEQVPSQFAFFVFLAWQKTGVFRHLSGGVGINHLSAGKFSQLQFPLPSLAEQHEIVRHLSLRLEELEVQQAAIEHSLKQSTTQRKNILQAAFGGQLVPQDPADEPASRLLARIRAEREAAFTAVKSKSPRGRKAKGL
jgi:type I restriction enzyme, S subunit